jgi:hypothetical protein
MVINKKGLNRQDMFYKYIHNFVWEISRRLHLEHIDPDML